MSLCLVGALEKFSWKIYNLSRILPISKFIMELLSRPGSFWPIEGVDEILDQIYKESRGSSEMYSYDDRMRAVKLYIQFVPMR